MQPIQFYSLSPNSLLKPEQQKNKGHLLQNFLHVPSTGTLFNHLQVVLPFKTETSSCRIYIDEEPHITSLSPKELKNKTCFSVPTTGRFFVRPKEFKTLLKLGLAWDVGLLKDLYQTIDKIQFVLFYVANVNYPAIFKGIAKSKKGDKNFELIIQPPNKAYLLEKELIGRGQYKKVFKVYCLNDPKLMACSYSRFGASLTYVPQQESEAFCLKTLNGHPRFPETYEIFYYNHHYSQAQKKTATIFKRQVILMEYYSIELFDKILSLRNRRSFMNDQEKMKISLQLLDAIMTLHQKNMTHRDIKAENIMLSNRGMILIDFGLSCQLDDKKALNQLAGTINFYAPELGKKLSIEAGDKLDVWSAGCLLWFLWSESRHPWWHTPSSGKKYDIDEVLAEISKFNQSPSPKYKNSLFYLIWNMLREDPKERWDTMQVLNFLNELQTKLPKGSSYHLKNEFRQQCREFVIAYRSISLVRDRTTMESNN